MNIKQFDFLMTFAIGYVFAFKVIFDVQSETFESYFDEHWNFFFQQKIYFRKISGLQNPIKFRYYSLYIEENIIKPPNP